MITLLSTLLYLGLISGPRPYSYAELLEIQQDNDAAIRAVQNDSRRTQTAYDQFHGDAESIVVPDYFEEE